jgi:hypothetical protein
LSDGRGRPQGCIVASCADCIVGLFVSRANEYRGGTHHCVCVLLAGSRYVDSWLDSSAGFGLVHFVGEGDCFSVDVFCTRDRVSSVYQLVEVACDVVISILVEIKDRPQLWKFCDQGKKRQVL